MSTGYLADLTCLCGTQPCGFVGLCGLGLHDLPVWHSAFVALSACVALACVARPCCVLGLCGLGLRCLPVWHSALVASSACVA